jgi:hypothetical protein
MNLLISNLLTEMQNRYVEDRETISMSQWVAKNTTMKGRPFSYRGYEFQQAIVDDMHPDLACIKCSQVGLSEVQIRKILGLLKRSSGVNALFSLPFEEMFKRMSQTRFRPILEQDRVFNLDSDQGAVRTVGVVQIGQSFLYITGCTEKDATSLPLDILFHDELDLSDEKMIALFQSRLQNSDLKMTQAFSTPTFTGVGIDREYESSDQREYFVRCDACNLRQVPLFMPKFIQIEGLPHDLEDFSTVDAEIMEKTDLLNAYVCCEKCRSPLDLTDPSKREWVAAYPSRILKRGYRVRPFSTHRLTIPYIFGRLLKAKDQDNLRSWYNTVLGESYTDSNIRLSEEDIIACMGAPAQPEISSDDPVFIGIDVGLTCHIVLGTPGKGIFLMETCQIADLEARVDQFLRQYRVVMGTVDRHPYTNDADNLRHLSNGRVMPVEYRGVAPLSFVKDEYESITHVQCNRTQVLDQVSKIIRKRALRMEGYREQRRTVIDHLRDLIRDETPEKPAVWKKLTGGDHYFHAISFYLFAIRLKGAIDELNGEDVRTTVGFGGAQVTTIPDGIIALKRQNRGLFHL